MNIVQVEDLKPGMIYDRPLFIKDSDEQAEAANTPLTEDTIKRLMKWGVTALETEGSAVRNAGASLLNKTQSAVSPAQLRARYEDLLAQRKLLISVYKKVFEAVEFVHKCIKNEEPFNLTGLETAATDMIRIIHANKRCYIYLYEFGEGRNYFVNHSVNTAFYAVMIGSAMGYSAEKLKDLAVGTMLIDAGMMKMPVYIIYKQSSLTSQEYNQIRTHPLLGYRDIKRLAQVPEHISEICLQHHERFDGSGYPQKLKGKAISEFAGIASVADSYEAAITKRSYKKRQGYYDSMRDILTQSQNRYDFNIIRAFISAMSYYPMGTIVRLNDSSTGVVVDCLSQPLRPVIKMITDKNEKRISGLILVNLLERPDLSIVSVLDEEKLGVTVSDIL